VFLTEIKDNVALCNGLVSGDIFLDLLLSSVSIRLALKLSLYNFAKGKTHLNYFPNDFCRILSKSVIKNSSFQKFVNLIYKFL